MLADEPVCGDPSHQRHDRIEQRNINELPFARTLTIKERGHDRECGIQSPNRVAHRETCAQRVQPLIAVDCHFPAQTLNDLVVRGLHRVRAGLAESRDAAVDNSRIHFLQHIITNTETIHYIGAKIFDDNIRSLHELQEDFFGFRFFEVECEGFLVRVLCEKTRSHQLVV